MSLKQKAFFTFNMTEMSEILCKENFAIALPGNDIQDLKIKSNIHCHFYQIENPLYVTLTMTALAKNSPYKKIFDFL